MLTQEQIKQRAFTLSNLHTNNARYACIVDFTRPANEHRLFVVDVKRDEIIFSSFTSHGKNSGPRNGKNLKFSNVPNSKMSCKGVLKTGSTYYGKYGYSLKLHGLQKGINDKAFERFIVIHPSEYVKPKYVRQHKYPGRSWGCITLDPIESEKIINYLKDGSIVEIYAG